jgi:signal recognition particle receptor subunit beta
MNLKIVVSGPFASGKTQLIKTLSEIDVVLTERKIKSEEERSVKEETTVAMDFGKLTIEKDLVLYLFGTPGQERFDFMWQILGEGALGVVVMVDSTDGENIRKARRIIDFFYTEIGTTYVVAANKQDLPNAWPPEFIRSYLDLDESIRVIPCVATEKESAKNVLLELLELVLERN